MGAIAAALGALPIVTPPGFAIEEEIGLAALFKLRGARPVPDDVVVVSIDKASAEQHCVRAPVSDQLCGKARWWPRDVHAQLVDGLTRAGAHAIALDVRFETPRDADDARLGAAMARSRRVVVAEFLDREEFAIGAAKASKQTRVPPLDEVRRGALATALFVLPTRPVRVNAYSPFPREAGEPAAFPVAAFQIAALPAYTKLVATCAPLAATLPAPPVDAQTFAALVDGLRHVATTSPQAAEHWRRCAATLPPADARMLDALLDVYAHDGPRYFNFYGPPQSVKTVSYSQALTALAAADGKAFAGQAVFVGVSETAQMQQKDSYYTVFSREDGLDLSGVELAATAYANLLENRELSWDAAVALALVLAWGFAVGAIARGLATPYAALAISALAAVYGAGAYHAFAEYALWLPLVVPLLLQAPAAFALGALAQHRELTHEKNNIRRAFGHFLPEDVVDELARDVTHIPEHSHLVSGTCLATDVQGYTSIAETLDPGELRLIMNEYYASVFAPVAAHRGIVSDVVGDAMVAIWAAATDNAALREQACRAAFEISAAAEAFGRTPHRPALPTRIGLDSGRMALGNVGGISHYEYRAVGDIVNTASRIQSLNKVLGTKVLMSAAVFEGASGLVARHLGEFRLRGKSKPVSIYELAAVEPHASEEQRWLCSTFETALAALRAQRWKDAERMLLDVIARFPQDGPARFYLELLEREHAGPERWDGVVAVGSD